MNMLRDNRSPARSRVTWLVLENISRLASKRGPDTNNSLTFREKQVLELVKKGMSNKEIADVLSIASNTVKNHIHHLLEKLNVRSRHEAAWVENHRPLRSAG
jgi:DNA-binding NarL/FixJ family response regulator